MRLLYYIKLFPKMIKKVNNIVCQFREKAHWDPSWFKTWSLNRALHAKHGMYHVFFAHTEHFHRCIVPAQNSIINKAYSHSSNDWESKELAGIPPHSSQIPKCFSKCANSLCLPNMLAHILVNGMHIQQYLLPALLSSPHKRKAQMSQEKIRTSR